MTTAEEEVMKAKILAERIKAPSVWGGTPFGLRIEDLQDKRYDEAIRLLRDHYLNEEVTYKSVRILDDAESVAEFVACARVWMKDKMSLVAVKESTDKVVGVCLMRLQDKLAYSRTFSRLKFTRTSLYTKVSRFLNEVERGVDCFRILRVKKYMKIYAIALKPRYRHRGVSKQLIKAAMRVCVNANVPALIGLFTTARAQEIASSLGFDKINEIYYVRYLEGDKVVFWDTGEGNFGTALMARKIPEIYQPEPAEEEQVEEEGDTNYNYSEDSIEKLQDQKDLGDAEDEEELKEQQEEEFLEEERRQNL